MRQPNWPTNGNCQSPEHTGTQPTRPLIPISLSKSDELQLKRHVVDLMQHQSAHTFAIRIRTPTSTTGILIVVVATVLSLGVVPPVYVLVKNFEQPLFKPIN